MKRSKVALFKIRHMMMFAPLVLMGAFGYLTNASLKEVQARVDFFCNELGIYHPVLGEIYSAEQLAFQVDEKNSSFLDAVKTSHLAAKIYKGLTEEKQAYVKSRYLAIFLEADTAYLESGLSSQRWEALRAHVAMIAKENRGAWFEELDKLDAQAKIVFERSLAFEITNALTPYLTLGRYKGIPELAGFENSMMERTHRARLTIDSISSLLDGPATSSS